MRFTNYVEYSLWHIMYNTIGTDFHPFLRFLRQCRNGQKTVPGRYVPVADHDLVTAFHTPEILELPRYNGNILHRVDNPSERIERLEQDNIHSNAHALMIVVETIPQYRSCCSSGFIVRQQPH